MSQINRCHLLLIHQRPKSCAYRIDWRGFQAFMSQESIMNAIGAADAFLGSNQDPSTPISAAATAITTLETYRALPVPDRPYTEEDVQVLDIPRPCSSIRLKSLCKQLSASSAISISFVQRSSDSREPPCCLDRPLDSCRDPQARGTGRRDRNRERRSSECPSQNLIIVILLLLSSSSSLLSSCSSSFSFPSPFPSSSSSSSSSFSSTLTNSQPAQPAHQMLPQITLLQLITAYEVVLRKIGLEPGEDVFYYRFLLKLALDPSGNWWVKFRREVEAEGLSYGDERQVLRGDPGTAPPQRQALPFPSFSPSLSSFSPSPPLLIPSRPLPFFRASLPFCLPCEREREERDKERTGAATGASHPALPPSP